MLFVQSRIVYVRTLLLETILPQVLHSQALWSLVIGVAKPTKGPFTTMLLIRQMENVEGMVLSFIQRIGRKERQLNVMKHPTLRLTKIRTWVPLDITNKNKLYSIT